MERVQPTRTVYTVGQFLDWQRSRTLDLSPVFQRRPVWKSSAKSLLIDSVVRGYPIPVILLRQVQDLESLRQRLEVVDGQQRLRTLLAFIDPISLPDYSEDADSFTVRRIHNRQIGETPFAKLSHDDKNAVLLYELSTHVFPATTGDDLIFRIFARLNSTGLSLNHQEIRNSQFHGHFKTLVYDISLDSFDYWKKWRIFSYDQISRMEEAEAVSEYLIAMINGIEGKNQRRITKFYRDHEDALDGADVLRHRFEVTIAAIDKNVGDVLPASAFRRPALFYSLYAALYDHLFGLKSRLERSAPTPLPAGLADRLHLASNRIRTSDLPDKVQDAMERATADKARRDTRHRFIVEALDLDHAQREV
ncbi:MAG: DUF262 domain-containing protein [Acidobacteriota bacterium]